MSKKRRLVLRAAFIAVALAAAATPFLVVRLADIGAAYKAKMLCSEVFVAGRTADQILAELNADDLDALRFLDATVDEAQRRVVVSLAGVVERTAAFRGGAGCALEYGGPPASVRQPPNVVDVNQVDDLPVTLDGRLDVVLDEAFSEPVPDEPRRTRAVVVVRDGRIVAERYAAAITAATPLLGWSMAKSVMNALVGILVGEGRLSLGTRADAPEWRAPDDSRAGITVDQLLRMTSGLDFDERMTVPFNDVIRMLLGEPDMGAFAATRPLEAEPGSRWEYASGTTLVLSRLLRETLGDAYWQFPRQALFDRVGMHSAVIETDASGTFVGSSFMYATARDWARFGMLYLQDGVWKGVRILPVGWVDYSRTPTKADATGSYGAHFWLRLADNYNASRSALPRDAFHAAGHEGQFVSIVPSRSVVIVRLGRTRYARSWDQGAFVRRVLDALEAPGD